MMADRCEEQRTGRHNTACHTSRWYHGHNSTQGQRAMPPDARVPLRSLRYADMPLFSLAPRVMHYIRYTLYDDTPCLQYATVHARYVIRRVC